MGMTLKVKIAKAQGITGNEVPDLELSAIEAVPDEFESLDEARVFYAGQAGLLVDALLRVLPGGIIDAFMAEMMRRRASLFVIPIFDPSKLEDINDV